MADDRQLRPRLLVTDFDGTLTRRDFFWLAVDTFAPAHLEAYWQAYEQGRCTHFEALAGIFAHLPSSEEQMHEMLARAELEPELPQWLERLGRGGWEVVVASAGCEWYIRRILGRAGVELPIHANLGTFEPGVGLHMRLPTESPYFSPEHGIDKAGIVRAAQGEGRLVAFAGDGNPDLAAAVLVPPQRRFARHELATALDRRGLPYRPFERWREVAEALCRE